MKKILPCVIGLGYVGLPVFISLKKKFKVVGFDTNKKRVSNLNNLIDTNREFIKNDLRIKNKSIITDKPEKIKNCNFYIVTVPTPIKNNYTPDLRYIRSAFNLIAKNLKKDDIIFLESTVYPGTTEIFCKNILLKNKKSINKKNFFLGYSSERINPGDKKHNVRNIKKVVSIDANKNITNIVRLVYRTISKKIIFSHKIKETELSKLIENTQRDINISLMNEIMILCKKTKIDYEEVIRLAKTKWNFLNFSPGLVGGHCLPVDPYYLSYFANKSNYNTKITLAGRETNNSMTNFTFNLINKEIKRKTEKKNIKISVAGLTYKPNVSDLRNSLALKIYKKLDDARNQNLIGSSLDATIILHANTKTFTLLKDFKDELKFIFISSDCKLIQSDSVEDIDIVVEKNINEKCDRCWHKNETVGKIKDHKKLCSRCYANIFEQSEIRTLG